MTESYFTTDFKPEESFAALVKLAEKPRTCAVDGEGYHDYDGDTYRWYSLTCGHRLCIPDYKGDSRVIGMYCPYCARRIAG